MGFWGVLVPGLLVIALCCSCSSWVLSVEADGALPACDFPAIYNFGDSNSDTGGISAAFDPIPPPYGSAFFHKPAGRDCDGRLIVDFIGKFFYALPVNIYMDLVISSDLYTTLCDGSRHSLVAKQIK